MTALLSLHSGRDYSSVIAMIEEFAAEWANDQDGLIPMGRFRIDDNTRDLLDEIDAIEAPTFVPLVVDDVAALVNSLIDLHGTLGLTDEELVFAVVEMMEEYQAAGMSWEEIQYTCHIDWMDPQGRLAAVVAKRVSFGGATEESLVDSLATTTGHSDASFHLGPLSHYLRDSWKGAMGCRGDAVAEVPAAEEPAPEVQVPHLVEQELPAWVKVPAWVPTRRYAGYLPNYGTPLAASLAASSTIRSSISSSSLAPTAADLFKAWRPPTPPKKCGKVKGWSLFGAKVFNNNKKTFGTKLIDNKPAAIATDVRRVPAPKTGVKQVLNKLFHWSA